ncbi:hypothetical protein ACN20G_06640 [Streptomyces sp. BI20]|uniref:hypothetical protein n=1 Tax=Streptomyces sp. BI20 TaxID=3403460 RepID=UPI003C7651BF
MLSLRLPALLAGALLVLTGCGTPGGLVSAGPTQTASGPVHLWPRRVGASVAPADPGGAPPEYVTGLPPVRGQDVHTVDPLRLVLAELDAHGAVDVGPDGMPPETAAAIRACRTPGGSCPVLAPYYRDLTGNHKDELIIGIEYGGPDRLMAVRVYTADPDGRLNRIMATVEPVISVEMAGRDVILRAPSGNAGYELITAWSYEESRRSMLPTREQIVRVPTRPGAAPPTGGFSTGPVPSDGPGAPPSPSASPGAGSASAPAGTGSTGGGGGPVERTEPGAGPVEREEAWAPGAGFLGVPRPPGIAAVPDVPAPGPGRAPGVPVASGPAFTPEVP